MSAALVMVLVSMAVAILADAIGDDTMDNIGSCVTLLAFFVLVVSIAVAVGEDKNPDKSCVAKELHEVQTVVMIDTVPTPVTDRVWQCTRWE